ncbi:MAG: circadian clock protein KaiC [Mycobacteriales bacterium]
MTSSPLNPAIRGARAADAVVLGDQDTLGTRAGRSVPKVETGIPGFDAITMGGLPWRRATVLAGQAGSGKTVFAAHFLAEGVRRGQPGVFVSLEEPATDLRANMATLGWDAGGWESAGDLAIVDASPLIRDDGAVAAYNFDTLAAQIGHAVDVTGAERLVLDSLNTVLAFEDNVAIARQKLRRLISSLRGMGLTVLLTVETPDDPGTTLSRFGIEEFVGDSVVLLRHIHEGKVRRRSVEVLKMRGAMHRKGDFGFTVLPGQGVVVLPQAVIQYGQETEPRRISIGVAGLDELSGGGFFHDSIVLVSGATGSGKTCLSTAFLHAGAAAGERVLLLSYEESPGQLFRNAAAWGIDLVQHQQSGLLKVLALYPEVASLDDHLIEIMEVVDSFKPSRIVVDSLSSLERIGSTSTYREFVIGLAAFVKQEQITMLVTLSTSALNGGAPTTEGHISTLTDAIVLLRYVPEPGRVDRAMTLLKMRGSAHDTSVRRYTITSEGMQIGAPLESPVAL